MAGEGDTNFTVIVVLVIWLICCLSSALYQFWFPYIFTGKTYFDRYSVKDSDTKTKPGFDGYEIAALIYGIIVLVAIVIAGVTGFRGNDRGMKLAAGVSAVLMLVPFTIASLRMLLDSYSST